MNSLVKFLKLWLPAIIWAGIIFWLSSIPHLKTNLKYDFILRKIAHAVEYFILTFLVYRAFQGSFKMNLTWSFICPGTVSFFYALSDEFHQSLVIGRNASIQDILVDSIGILGFYAAARILPLNQKRAVRVIRVLILSGIFASFMPFAAFASDAQSLPYTKEIGLISGYAHGGLQEKGSYKIIPVILRLGYSLDSVGLGFCDLVRPIADKLKMEPKGYTGLINEFHLNGVFAPDSNLEAGWTLLIKYSYPVTEKFHPYLIGGGGFGYITQQTREQSMQWGFTPQFGTGFSYFLKKNMAVNLEYRRRHFSNANIKRPNGGINVNMFLAGVSWFY